MPEHATSQKIFVLPQPRRVARQPGACHISSLSAVDIKVDDGRIARHVGLWLSRLSEDGQGTHDESARLVFGITPGLAPQAYKLSITVDCVLLEGGSAAGCFYGWQTLRQLTAPAEGMLPCCVIEDEPDFETRGVLHDVTRGKVPTLTTLKSLADRLSLLKINQLQLYIEHAFAFSFDSDICDADHGLSPDEVRALDEYCRERFIDLVPAVANLGHMGRILTMPAYRDLAEVKAGCDWGDMTWPERARGLTLNPDHPASQELVEKIWRDILASFSSPLVNICGDEPWDLGRSQASQTDVARMEMYLRHVGRVARLCEKEGRRVQLWSDVLRNHPPMHGQFPKDVTILHWGYDDAAEYEATSFFVDHGYRTMVCPGTSGWKRIINAMDLAERNIKTFAQAGQRVGASGLVVTDWGDHGHFNLLACSWHGITLGASLGWDANHITGAAFDAQFAHAVANDSGREFVAALRRASAMAGSHETWRLLWQPANKKEDEVSLPSVEALELCIEFSQLAVKLGSQLSPMAQLDRVDLCELVVACRANGLAARRLLWDVRRRAGFSRPDHSERCAWADAMISWWPGYEDCWRRRNKETGLADIHAAIMRVADEARML